MSGIVEKWGMEVSARGFAQIPNYLLLINTFVDEERRLSPVELLVLIQLVGAWWQKDKLPFPSMATLAKRSGVSERQIQRAVARLLKLNFIVRVNRRRKGIIASNAYDLTPLVELLEMIARAFPNAFPRRIPSPAKLRAPRQKAIEQANDHEPSSALALLPPAEAEMTYEETMRLLESLDAEPEFRETLLKPFEAKTIVKKTEA